jgi:hypothetical protein
MRHHKASSSHPSRKQANRLRRLSDAALFAVVRGAATAIGSALAGFALWWLANRR